MKRLIYCFLIISVSAQLFASGEKEKSQDEIAEGYTLFNGQASKITNLINNNGEVVHSWESEYKTGSSVYLQENGNLLRTATIRGDFSGSGGAGRVEEFNWDGDLIWEFEYADDKVLFHHDIEVLPNGNILVVAWERVSEAQSLNMGRDPELIPENDEGDRSVWMDHIIEVNREGEIVWEWHIYDHLIQDQDQSLNNYGVVSEHPELINVNYTGNNKLINDWNHVNAVDYNSELDQIMLSVRSFSELWVIDHSISANEAKTSKGDLLYRWGNPAAYDMGDESDQKLYNQHDAQWITEDNHGTGNILIFSNGDNDLRPYSTVEEITPSYTLEDGVFLPKDYTWHYEAENAESFYSDHISGAQRLGNGNTLICSGANGWIFEVDSDGDIVWEFTNEDWVKSPTGSEKNSMFRAKKYSPDFPGFEGRSLDILKTLVESEDSQPESELVVNTTEVAQLDIRNAALELNIDLEVLKELLGKPENNTLNYENAAKELNIPAERIKGIVEGLSAPVIEVIEPYTVSINGIDFIVSQPMYTWDNLPDSVDIEREPIKSFTNPKGDKHYYEVIYVKSINLNWYQTSYLAQDAGGYQTSITSAEENAFVFSLIDDEKYFWAFPEDGGHYGIKIGPNLGGYQPKGSVEPAGGWQWLSGEPWEYTNWAVNLDDGIIDKDPRNNSQPNDSADGQPVMGFGELNLPVPTWGDYTDSNVKPNGVIRGSYAFIIEYETKPEV